MYVTTTFVIGSENLQDLNANFSISELIHKRGFRKPNELVTCHCTIISHSELSSVWGVG